MIKYVVQHLKGVTSVLEIECTRLTPLEDQSVAFLSSNDYKVKITEPKSLAGEVWFGWALFDSSEQAMFQAVLDMVEEAQRNERKHKVPYDKEATLAKSKEIPVRMLK